MAERASYPYRPGEFGIKLPPTTNGAIIGGSGRPLSITHEATNIVIHDEYNLCRMEAYATLETPLHYSISFNLRTRSDKRVHHPDMFAGEFQKYSLALFSEKFAISSWRSVWVKGSDNYRQFEILTGSGLSDIQAARFTWTGIQSRKFGFDAVSEVRRGVDSNDFPHIKVVYVRKAIDNATTGSSPA